ncbi:hypothetical protein OGATHE_000590 [Ogataea polymorpha]|uniref:Uncharacterized protein n=1 Tax=Ogataea polymorpha TaxID=460523 RepID=A0A9P8PUM2_9ASCO|nr:hypothetical protein OGATHE_000590 [Ogataea polymorpha]
MMEKTRLRISFMLIFWLGRFGLNGFSSEISILGFFLSSGSSLFFLLFLVLLDVDDEADDGGVVFCGWLRLLCCVMSSSCELSSLTFLRDRVSRDADSFEEDRFTSSGCTPLSLADSSSTRLSICSYSASLELSVPRARLRFSPSSSLLSRSRLISGLDAVSAADAGGEPDPDPALAAASAASWACWRRRWRFISWYGLYLLLRNPYLSVNRSWCCGWHCSHQYFSGAVSSSVMPTQNPCCHTEHDSHWMKKPVSTSSNSGPASAGMTSSSLPQMQRVTSSSDSSSYERFSSESP